MDAIRQQLQEVFREVFKDPDLVLHDNMTADNVDGWDSLAHINLIIAVEKRLRVKFATAEISRLKADDANVGKMVELLARKQNVV
jgi:acyl carrier protein